MREAVLTVSRVKLIKNVLVSLLILFFPFLCRLVVVATMDCQASRWSKMGWPPSVA